MAKTERKKRDNLKRDILEAARRMFLKHGYQSTSMRKIAAEVGVSATSIYLHYKDKADVMHALHQEGFKLLNEQFKTLEYVEHPFERLKAMGRCYINFAIENREYYEIMFIMREPLEHLKNPDECGLGWEEGESAFHFLVEVVKDCQSIGYFKTYDVQQLALLVWANMHGLCALNNNGHLQLLSERIAMSIEVSQVMQSSFALYAKMIENI